LFTKILPIVGAIKNTFPKQPYQVSCLPFVGKSSARFYHVFFNEMRGSIARATLIVMARINEKGINVDPVKP
jgi:uncharacterized membrane protein YbaN (DUF454 family)